MKFIVIVCSLIAVVICRPQDPQETYYNNRYDDFDVMALTGNKRLLTAYGKCFLSTGPCTSEGSDFKKTIPDALKTKCAKCTRKQRELIRTVIKAFQANTPELWQQLTLKEDPNGQYKESFENFISASN